MSQALQQRCWNHESREAVCRCPECTRGFCRECVAEHQGRFLCAACLRALTQTQPEKPARTWVVFAGLAVAGVALAWTVYFFAGEAMLTLFGRLEQTAWLSR